MGEPVVKLWKALCACLSSINSRESQAGASAEKQPTVDVSLKQLEDELAKLGSAVSEDSTRLEHSVVAALRNAGRLKEALALAETSEARVSGAYGTAHPHTLHSQWLLATVLHRLGAGAPSGDGKRDAQALHRQVLARRLELLGAAHPSVAESQYELGLCLQASGLALTGDDRASLLFEAETLFREVCRFYASQLTRPTAQKAALQVQALAASTTLASLLRNSTPHRLTEAEGHLRSALDALLVSVGPLHMETLVAKNQLGQLLHERGQHDEALVLLRGTLKGRLETLGSHHPQVYNSRRALSHLLKDMGRADEAQRVLRLEDVKELEKNLGGEHRVTHKALETLEDINQAVEELKAEERRLEKRSVDEKHQLAEELRRLEQKLEADKWRLRERNEQLRAEKERLLYDMQRRGPPLDDDRNAIRRGLRVGRPSEPYNLAGGTDHGSTSSSSEAVDSEPADAPPPSLPPGPPSSISSEFIVPALTSEEVQETRAREEERELMPMEEVQETMPLTWEEVGRLWFPEVTSAGESAEPSMSEEGKPGAAFSPAAARLTPSAAEASLRQGSATGARAADRQALVDTLADEGGVCELQRILNAAKDGILGRPANAININQHRAPLPPSCECMPAHCVENTSTPEQALSKACHCIQMEHTEAEVYKAIGALAIALGAIRTEAGTIKALHAVLLQLVRPKLTGAKACLWVGASLSNFAKWRRRVKQIRVPIGMTGLD